MKKLMTLAAIAAFATAASASTLSWGYGGGYLFVADLGDTKAVGAHDYEGDLSGAQFVLVYLGQSSTFTADTIEALNSNADAVKDRLDVAIRYDSEYGDSYATPESKSFNVTDAGDSPYREGDYFGIAFFDGTSYSALFAVTDYDERTIGESIFPTVKMGSLDPTSPSNNRILLGSDSGPSDDYDVHMAGVYASVPEPSVALLGLLGLGMLLKRRKA